MTDNIKAVDSNGWKVLLDANTNIIELFSGGTSGVKTLLTPDGTPYQVPTGKKSTLIYITDMFGNGSTDLFHGDTQDSTSDQTTIFTPRLTVSNIPLQFKDIPAGRYVNYDNDGQTVQITLVEESAT